MIIFLLILKQFYWIKMTFKLHRLSAIAFCIISAVWGEKKKKKKEKHITALLVVFWSDFHDSSEKISPSVSASHPLLHLDQEGQGRVDWGQTADCPAPKYIKRKEKTKRAGSQMEHPDRTDTDYTCAAVIICEVQLSHRLSALCFTKRGTSVLFFFYLREAEVVVGGGGGGTCGCFLGVGALLLTLGSAGWRLHVSCWASAWGEKGPCSGVARTSNVTSRLETIVPPCVPTEDGCHQTSSALPPLFCQISLEWYKMSPELCCRLFRAITNHQGLWYLAPRCEWRCCLIVYLSSSNLLM